MAAKRPLNKPTPGEVTFWQEAFVAAELSVLLKVGTRVSPVGAAHLMGEFADAALTEHRRRFNKR